MSTLQKKYYTVQDTETLKLLFQHIQESEVIAVDTETTGLNPRKDQVIGWSVSGEEGIGFYLPTLVWNFEKGLLELQHIAGESCEALSRKLLPMLKGKKLVFHNASFDVQFIHNFFGVDLSMDVWVDTGLLVHTVNEEGAPMKFGSPFGLKSIAKMEQEALGLDVETEANEEQVLLKESIKRNGGSVTKADYQIYKADLELLSKYAAADTDLTLRICNLYLQKLKQENLEKFFFEDEVMPIYREVTLPMERAGVDLDVELLDRIHKEISEDLITNKQIVIKSLLKQSSVKKWIVDKAFEAYPPSTRGNWPQRLVQRYSVALPKSEKTGKYRLTKSVLEKFVPSTPEEEMVIKYLQTEDISVLPELEVARISTALWKESNDGEYLNIQSKMHLGEIVFDYLGEKPLVKGSATKSGRDKFDMDMIAELSKKYEWAENLRIYNKLLKIKSTYVDRFREGQENGRYYFYFKQNGTVSGRYGSDAQQLPKPLEEGQDAPILMKYVNIVRAFLVAGKGRKIIDADYESLEPHCFASVSGDPGLQEIFAKNWDFYSTVAIKTEKLDEDKANYPNGVSADKKSPIFLKKLNPVKRNTAKGYALGIAYGMEAYALSRTLDIDQKEAQKLVDGYLNGFPELKKWRENSRKQVKEKGYVTNYVGRVRHLPRVQKIFEKYGDQMMDWRFRKSLEPTFGKDQVNKAYRDYRNGLNNCLNFQLQSLAAAVVNRAALQINRKAKEMGIDAFVQAQVHDQLIINIEEGKEQEFAPVVQHLMEITTQLPGVTLKAPPEISDNWRDGH